MNKIKWLRFFIDKEIPEDEKRGKVRECALEAKEILEEIEEYKVAKKGG